MDCCALKTRMTIFLFTLLKVRISKKERISCIWEKPAIYLHLRVNSRLRKDMRDILPLTQSLR